MIATILKSTSTFHAVRYNEGKVEKGSASLLEIKNFGKYSTLGYDNPEQLVEYLKEYSSRNSRIKEPQFHLAISCKGNEYTPQQLLDFAHAYLDQMGYGDPDQPLLIYEHHDTDNTHLHIITSRVNPQGKKIKDSNERRRSQKVIEKLMKTDLKANAQRDIKVALKFDFRSVNQFRSVMQAMGYECFGKGEKLFVKKGGMIQCDVDKAMIERLAENNQVSHTNDVAQYAKWRSIFSRYRETNSSREGFERDLKKKFGISLICFGPKDSPYGYVAIDFANNKVIDGGRIMPITSLFDFRSREEHLKSINDFIDNIFEKNPRITTLQLNKQLSKLGAYIKKDQLVFGSHKEPLEDYFVSRLSANNKIAWRNGFEPQSNEERILLSKLTGWDYPDYLTIKTHPDGRYFCKDFNELNDILNISDSDDRLDAFENANFRLISANDTVYAYRPDTQSMTDLKKAGFDPDLVDSFTNDYNNRHNINNNNRKINPPVNQRKSGRGQGGPNRSGGGKKQSSSKSQSNSGANINQQDKQQNKNKKNGSMTSGGGKGAHVHVRGDNREWEVGKKGHDQDNMENNSGLSM